MKKFLALLLAAALLLALPACNVTINPAGETASPSATAKPSPTAAPPSAPSGVIVTDPAAPATDVPVATATPEPERGEPVVIVELDHITSEYKSDADKLLVVAEYSNLYLSIEGREAVAAAICENESVALKNGIFAENADEGENSVESLLAVAKQADQDGYLATNYAISDKLSAARTDGAVISLLHNSYYNAGGAHGFYGVSGTNYDAETGAELSLSDLSDDADALSDFLLERVRELAPKHENAAGYFDNYQEYLPDLIQDGLWYFDSEGMVFVANVYMLGTYAAGMYEYTIPYGELEGHIDEKWLPTPDDDAYGELTASGDKTMGQVLYYTAADKGSDYCRSVFVRAEGAVKNVELHRVDCPDGVSAYESELLLKISRLESGEVFEIYTAIPETIPNLKLSYELSDGTEQHRYISESGQDGSVILVDLGE